MQAEYVPEMQWRHRAVRSRPAQPGERKPHERFPEERIASPDRALGPWANRLWRPALPVLFLRPDVFRPAIVRKGLGNEGARERLSRSGGRRAWLAKRQRARGEKRSATLSMAWDSCPPSPLVRGRNSLATCTQRCQPADGSNPGAGRRFRRLSRETDSPDCDLEGAVNADFSWTMNRKPRILMFRDNRFTSATTEMPAPANRTSRVGPLEGPVESEQRNEWAERVAT